jgi:hypothetical protein
MRIVLRTISEFFDSRRRGICVWLGFSVVLALTTFPPWIGYSAYRPATRVRLWHAHRDPAPLQIDYYYDINFADVDYRRMVTEIVAGEFFVLALYLTWGRVR